MKTVIALVLFLCVVGCKSKDPKESKVTTETKVERFDENSLFRADDLSRTKLVLFKHGVFSNERLQKIMSVYCWYDAKFSQGINMFDAMSESPGSRFDKLLKADLGLDEKKLAEIAFDLEVLTKSLSAP